MPIDEEQPNFALDLNNEAKRTLREKLMSSGVAGVLSLVPRVGAAVSELMTERAGWPISRAFFAREVGTLTFPL